MGDTLSWGMKLNSFCDWAKNASTAELKRWLLDVKDREWAYRDEIPIVKDILKERKEKPTKRDVETKLIGAKMGAASKLRLRARNLSDQARALEIEATHICSHPPKQVIKWYHLNYDQAYCSFQQCTQCGLREEGSVFYVLPPAEGKDYHKIDNLYPEEAVKCYVRTVTKAEQDEAMRQKRENGH